MFENLLSNFQIVPLYEVALRVGLAALFSFLIGFDRKKRDKPMSFPVFIIVAITTCLVSIMSQELYAQYESADNVLRIDLSRIIAGILTGIGFLGAGAIMQRNNNYVMGATTGASVWAAGGLGLMLGFGFYILAVLAFLLIIFTISVLQKYFS